MFSKSFSNIFKNSNPNQMEPTKTETKKSLLPKSVPFIIGNEAAERFSFYAIRAIMPIF
jgi:proton-dependent oligopeptide transporter, POT family